MWHVSLANARAVLSICVMMGGMPTGKRATNRASMESEILRLGREQLKTRGAADLSLRAIAREMGVVSSAVYRYVSSRDDLLTRLLVEAYNDLADTTQAALDTASADHRSRVRAIAESARAWALADPSRWALLYGSPVPGYAAPAELTVIPGTRVIAQFLTELDHVSRAGELTATVAVDPPLSSDLQAIRSEFASDLSDSELAAALVVWSVVIGAISLEVFGQYGTDAFAAPEMLFATQIEAVLSLLFVPLS